ncbi:hypothetical protein HJFPF1_13148 [Paramyrothecium foliicola]|nr:hypothetical protein HJFPF1_13148 [Paramyrothecium foliicola]
MARTSSGIAHKIISVLLRLGELASGVIVMGILARFCYLISIPQAWADGRVVYAMVCAGITIVYSIFFSLPFKPMFLAFPVDFILFVMWLVAFCLLQTRTRGHACSVDWYYNYWGYYWGRHWRDGPAGTVRFDGDGCAQWKTTLAFSFLAWFFHLLSGILGAYVFHNYIKLEDTKRDIKHHTEKITKSHPRDQGYQQGLEGQNGAHSTVTTTAV